MSTSPSFSPAGPPDAATPVPEVLRALVREHVHHEVSFRPVWLNGVGGLTFAVSGEQIDSTPLLFAKWNPSGSSESLGEEAERLRYLEGRHPVPVVVDYRETQGAEALLMRALPGESAVSERWKARPNEALIALGKGLRQLHDVPIEGCPYDWGLSHRLQADAIAPEAIGAAPSIDRLVLCHGDACAPNTVIADDGSFLAHVDLGRLGVADRWADLAVVTMSLGWNYSDYDGSVFWETYGVPPDVERILFYRDVWNAA